MAALAFGANVIPGADAKLTFEVAGEAPMTAGQTVYRDAADNRVKLAVNNNVAKKEVLGVLCHPVAVVGQPVTVQTDGEMTGATGLTKGEVYVLSATAGSACPVADLVTNNWVAFVAIALSATSLRLRPFNAGVQK